MRVEPAVSLAGHIAVPGDKSVSHRAVLLGAVGEGETLVRGFGRSADTEATIAAVRALGVTSTTRTSTPLRVGVPASGPREPGGPIDCGNSGTTRASSLGVLAGPAGTFTLTGDDSPGAPGPPHRRAARRDGRAHRDDRRQAAAADSRRRRSTAISTAPGRERTGEVRASCSPASASRRSHLRHRSTADARPHRAASSPPWALRIQRRPAACRSEPAERLTLGEIAVPGRLLGGRAVHRGARRSSPTGGHGPRRRPQPDANRAPRRARADGRADHDLPPARVPAVSPSATSSCSRRALVATTVHAEEVPRLIDELPLFALVVSRARGRAPSKARESCA